MPIASGLEKDVDHVAVLVDGPPEILLTPLNIDEQFVQVPGVAHRSLAAPERARVRRPERATPLPNRLVGHDDAPLGEEIFRIAEAQTEPVVEPDGVTDDLGRKSIAVIAGRLAVIGLLCQSEPQLDNTLPSYLVWATSKSGPFHVLFAADVDGDNVRVVTADRPNTEEWESDLKSRKGQK